VSPKNCDIALCSLIIITIFRFVFLHFHYILNVLITSWTKNNQGNLFVLVQSNPGHICIASEAINLYVVNSLRSQLLSSALYSFCFGLMSLCVCANMCIFFSLNMSPFMSVHILLWNYTLFWEGNIHYHFVKEGTSAYHNNITGQDTFTYHPCPSSALSS
jgi:hypothetical protein